MNKIKPQIRFIHTFVEMACKDLTVDEIKSDEKLR